MWCDAKITRFEVYKKTNHLVSAFMQINFCSWTRIESFLIFLSSFFTFLYLCDLLFYKQILLKKENFLGLTRRLSWLWLMNKSHISLIGTARHTSHTSITETDGYRGHTTFIETDRHRCHAFPQWDWQTQLLHAFTGIDRNRVHACFSHKPLLFTGTGTLRGNIHYCFIVIDRHRGHILFTETDRQKPHTPLWDWQKEAMPASLGFWILLL